MNRDTFTQQSLGIPLNRAVKESRVLMVGAGGIGCELLKNLVLSGFGEIHIVDLDTIDLSNLNRQFLFRHEHIKKPKALVARDAAHKFNPKVKLEAHHANIKDAEFSISWFKGFVMVFNALDNLDARRHVNKMCLAADVPLIESGTTGFNGQVQVIKKGITACYDCTPKDAPRSFPVCTIRSTPSQPIHCIVWGKSYLLSEIFGASEDESSDMDHSEDSENAKEITKLKAEAEALKNIRETMGTDAFPQLLFDKVYKDDVVRLRSMEEMWKTRRAPEALDYATLNERTKNVKPVDALLQDDQRAWSLEENLVVFKDSLGRLSQRMQAFQTEANGPGPAPSITFDKDDEDTLDFVAASANIRSIIFGIETKSRFDIKQMAGNIIPAIATTNAIVAGLCVMQAFKIIQGEYTNAREVYLQPFGAQRLLATDKARPPNPNCPVCSPVQYRLLVDMSRATLNDLVEDLLKLQLGYGEEFVVSNEIGILYDVDETDNLEKKLSELGIKGDSFLTVTDEAEEDERVTLILMVQESSEPLDDKPFKVLDASDGASIPRKQKKSLPPPEADVSMPIVLNGKRSLNGDTADLNPKKRAAPLEGSSTLEETVKRTKLDAPVTKAITIEDDGAILIDDD